MTQSYLCSFSLAFTVLLFSTSTLYAQRIYGIIQKPNDAFALVQVSPSSGTFIDYYDLPDFRVFDFSIGSCIDPTRNTLTVGGYDDNSQGHYFTYELSTGTQVASPLIDALLPVNQLQWNPNDSLIYGIQKLTNNQGHRLVTLDPLSGETELVQLFPDMEHSYAGVIATDLNQYLLIANDFTDTAGAYSVYTIDLGSEAMTISFLGHQFPERISATHFNPLTGKILGMRYSGAVFPYQTSFAELDRNTGSLMVIAPMDSLWVGTFRFAFDRYNSLSLMGGRHQSEPDTVHRLIGLNAITGAVALDVQVAERLRLVEYLDINLTGLEEATAVDAISLFPNPVIDRFKVTSDQRMARVAVNSVTGQRIFDQTNTSRWLEIDTTEWISGVYILSVWTDSGLQRQQFTVSH